MIWRWMADQPWKHGEKHEKNTHEDKPEFRRRIAP
jgi:hypothetical protein